MASSSNSSCVSGEYDVFLSFRGEDTRKTFVGHLYGALDRLGFKIFKDDGKLQRGKCISEDLFYYINHSKIAVIVFSENYTNSSWCLDELVEIMECEKKKKQIVLPIFYHVKPSQIRKQKMSFLEAFGKYVFYSQEMKKLERQRAALKEAANISGLELQDAANGDEAEFIQQILGVISEILKPQPFRVAEYPVGVNERADEIIGLLEDDYVELSDRAKDYAKGLPLALQVLGSTLGKTNKQGWLALLVRWEKNPPSKIDDVLRISYDGLEKEEKELFLDIACFFKGHKEEYVKNIYKTNNDPDVIGIHILCERCLICRSWDNTLSMHDLIQNMGRNIVRQESKDPGKRSRLWTYEDISEVLTNNTLTEKIEVIMLPKKGSSLEGIDILEEGLRISDEAFKIMRKLRILKINGVHLDGCLTHLSNELRYLEWNGYPGEYLPHNFCPKENVQLHLPNSLIKGIGTNSKVLKKLKVLNLNFCKNLVKDPNFSELPLLEELHFQGYGTLVEVKLDNMKLKVLDLGYCENLKQTPNLSGLPCLEKLHLTGCTSVVEVHPSIEFHKRLVHLDLTDCNNLKNLATRINLISLKTLFLGGCSKLEKFPDLQGDVECLEFLSLEGTAIKELTPSVVKHLQGLDTFDLRDCKMLEKLPNNIGEMKSLTQLSLSGSGIKRLPSSIAQLSRPWNLDWANCNLDEAIQNLPHSLRALNLRGSNFASLPESFNHLRLHLDDFYEGSFCTRLRITGKQESRIVVPGIEIPSWFSHIYEKKSGQIDEDMTNSVCLNLDYPNSLSYLKEICVAAVFQIEDYDDKLSEFPRDFNLVIEINGSASISLRYQIGRFKTDHFVLMRKTYDQSESRRVFGKCNSDGCCIKAEIQEHYFNDDYTLVKVKAKAMVKKWGIHPVMAGTNTVDD